MCDWITLTRWLSSPSADIDQSTGTKLLDSEARQLKRFFIWTSPRGSTAHFFAGRPGPMCTVNRISPPKTTTSGPRTRGINGFGFSSQRVIQASESEQPAINRCAGRASQRLAATALLSPAADGESNVPGWPDDLLLVGGTAQIVQRLTGGCQHHVIPLSPGDRGRDRRKAEDHVKLPFMRQADAPAERSLLAVSIRLATASKSARYLASTNPV